MKFNLKYDVNFSKSEVNFLDVKIKLINGKLQTDVFTKATDAHFFLRFNSCHPKHSKIGLLKSQFLRIRRICSDNSIFKKRANEFKLYFQNRDYPLRDIEFAINFASATDRNSLLNKTNKIANDRVPCVVSYHPSITRLPSIIYKNYKNIIENSNLDYLQKAFPEPPMVAYKQPPNLKNKLIQTDIFKVKVKKQISTTNHKCNRSRCKLCPIFNESSNFTNCISKKSITIRNGGNCTTSNCIYAITCNDCKYVNIGQTGRMLSDRIAGHRSDIKLSKLGNEKAIETAEHFKNFNHSGFNVTLLDHNSNWNINDRLFFEDLYIAKLKSLSPNGMNNRHNDIVKYFYKAI